MYAYCSAFLQKQSDRLEFIQKSIDIANSITSSYDRTRRFDLSLDSVINYDPSRLKDYYSILSEDFPEFLLEYIETPRMQKQDRIC